jgi:TIGR00251 family protein
MAKFREENGAVFFAVRVVPRASKSEIVGWHEDALKIRIASPPVDGAANGELIKLLAKKFDVSKSEVEILSGQTAKNKQVKISGAASEKIAEILGS